MFHLNLRQKMISCFALHLIFYTVLGLTFLKDFEMFHEDVSLLMKAGNLSNICLEIRRYEKNFIIRHDEEDFKTALKYVEDAINYVPGILKDLQIMPHPDSLIDLTTKLKEYRTVFESYRQTCTTLSEDQEECIPQETLRSLGQELVRISEDLVKFEQHKMIDFIELFKTTLLRSVSFLVVLTIFTLVVLYSNIILPLKSIEQAASRVAKGTFSLLEIPNASKNADEVSSVLLAFNRMVTELEEKQDQLFQAKKLSSIGTLASGTAHQINNPLNNISTSCQLALSEIERGNCQFIEKMLRTIEQETQRAGDIVRGLLEFSRAHTFSMQPVLFDDVVKNAMRLVASEVPPGVTITKDIPEGLTLYLDVQKMVEALLNLLINAIQSISSPPGTVLITATVDEQADKAIIIIEDTGIGIDEENIHKIFDPFFTTKNVDEGTGLGLAVVYGIINKQNGSTRVESVKGQGTRFIVTFPLCHEAARIRSDADVKNLREKNA